MKCPGQDMQYWKPDAIFEAKCPKCGSQVEFFKDDATRKCGNCGHRFINPGMDLGCAAYCPFAEQCIGNLPPELIAQRENLLKDRVAIEMKKYFKQDFKRIGHAMKVARYAERIAKHEQDCNIAVILASAYLHDIGIHEAERKYNSTVSKYQEQEGPPIAKAILTKLGANENLINQVCDIISHHHHPKEHDNIDFKVLYDADLIVNLEENQQENSEKPFDKDKFNNIIEKSFLTKTGQIEARKVLLK